MMMLFITISRETKVIVPKPLHYNCHVSRTLRDSSSPSLPPPPFSGMSGFVGLEVCMCVNGRPICTRKRGRAMGMMDVIPAEERARVCQ